jgi:hypothetical protein
VQGRSVDAEEADPVERRAQAGVAALVQGRSRALERAEQPAPRARPESVQRAQRAARAVQTREA